MNQVTVTPIQEIKSTIENMKPQFGLALPKHISVDKFTRVVQTALSNNPKLIEADRRSLYSACMAAAQDGLMPNGKEAAFVTFRTKEEGEKVQYMPMISGLLKLVRNSGELLSITSQLVYEADVFKYYVNEEGEHLSHEPNMLATERGKMIGAYALAKTKDGGVYIEVMNAKQLEDVKNSSRSKAFGPWAGAFQSEMHRKSVLKRLIKRLPLSTDIELEEDSYEQEPAQPVHVQIPVQEEPARKQSRLAQAISEPVTGEVLNESK